jgi:flavodoxin
MGKTLVVYYSRTGYTRRVAQEIAQRCGADIEAIEEDRSRAGIFGYLRSAREGYKKSLVNVRPADKDPANYDLIILGTPVWAGHVASPVRAYVEAHKRWLTSFAVFCTQGGSGGERVVAEVAALVGREPAAALVLSDAEITHSADTEKLERFAGALFSATAT